MELLDFDPLTGVKTFHDYDELTDETHVIISQDVEPILEANKRFAGETDAFRGDDNDFWRAASIPIGVQYEWLTKHGVDIYEKDHWPAVKKLLNDPDWRYLRTGHFIL